MPENGAAAAPFIVAISTDSTASLFSGVRAAGRRGVSGGPRRHDGPICDCQLMDGKGDWLVIMPAMNYRWELMLKDGRARTVTLGRFTLMLIE